jgi:hypothetical protein
MGDVGNAIKYLYSQFILRDVLSYITPGAIVVLTAFLILLPELTLKDSLQRLFEYSREMHWLLYIPLFGVFYMAGFAIECLGRILGPIRIHPFDKSYLGDRLKVFCPSRDEQDKKIWKGWEEHQEEELDVEKAIQEGKGWAQPTRERLIVLKQMCASGFLAIFIAVVLLGISYTHLFWLKLLLVVILVALLLASLFWGYRWAKFALDTAEHKVHPHERNNQGNK